MILDEGEFDFVLIILKLVAEEALELPVRVSWARFLARFTVHSADECLDGDHFVGLGIRCHRCSLPSVFHIEKLVEERPRAVHSP